MAAETGAVMDIAVTGIIAGPDLAADTELKLSVAGWVWVAALAVKWVSADGREEWARVLAPVKCAEKWVEAERWASPGS